MSTKSLILSSAGLKNIVVNANESQEYFTFKFGTQEIKVANLYAEFISPYVSQIHQSDPTIDKVEFSYSTTSKKSNDTTYEIISLFETLMKGEHITIDKEQSRELQLISLFIKNDELFHQLNEMFKEEYENENINEELHFLSRICRNSYTEGMIQDSQIISKIARNLYSISDEEILNVDREIFYSVIQNGEIVIESEDRLLELIDKFYSKMKEEEEEETETEPKRGMHRYERMRSKSEMYEEIEFGNLSSNKFKEFVDNFDINEMSQNLWNKLKKYFYPYHDSKSDCMQRDEITEEESRHHYTNKKKDDKVKKVEFDGQQEHAFKGIISMLTKENGGNVDDKNVVKVTSSSVNSSGRIAKYAVDLDDCNHYFQSGNQQDSWLQFDFQNLKISPTHYSIRTRHNGGKGCHHPKNWCIEGSNDTNSWTTIDTRSDITSLDDKNAISTFSIETSSRTNQFYRYIRIRQTGVNTYGYYHLTLSALEYFGFIKEE